MRKSTTIQLPKTLHAELTHKAKVTGVSLNQYIVDLLKRQVNQVLVTSHESYSDEDVQKALDSREPVEASEKLDPELVEKLKKRIAEKNQAV